MCKIKICGLKRPEDIKIVNDYQPDFGGFVFAGSKRKIDFDTAKSLRTLMDPGIQAVGVFVNEKIEFIEALCKENIIQLVQLHGDEEEAYINALKEKVRVPLIKAVRVRRGEDILEAQKLPVDYLLLDTYVEGAYGGSGVTFDKNLIPKLTKPYFLAGGLSTENVLERIEGLEPYGVDVSSGVETDGFKDPEKVDAFTYKLQGPRSNDRLIIL